MLGREVVEREQRVAILRQAIVGFIVFGTAVLFPSLVWPDLSAGISILDLATIVADLHIWVGWL